MNITEVKKIIASMIVSYSNYKPTDVDYAATIWADMLSEYTYEQVDSALRSFIMSDKSGFAPSIGQLVEKIHTMTQPHELNEMEAWSLVSKAIRNSGYNSTDEFAKLPPLVQKAVGLPGQLRTWALDENYNEEVAMSSFQRAYKAELKRHEELQKMPQNVHKIIERANEGSYSAQIADKRQKAIESTSERKQGEIKALEMKHDGVPMPEKYKERLEDMRNEKQAGKM